MRERGKREKTTERGGRRKRREREREKRTKSESRWREREEAARSGRGLSLKEINNHNSYQVITPKRVKLELNSSEKNEEYMH